MVSCLKERRLECWWSKSLRQEQFLNPMTRIMPIYLKYTESHPSEHVMSTCSIFGFFCCQKILFRFNDAWSEEINPWIDRCRRVMVEAIMYCAPLLYTLRDLYKDWRLFYNARVLLLILFIALQFYVMFLSWWFFKWIHQELFFKVFITGDISNQILFSALQRWHN